MLPSGFGLECLTPGGNTHRLVTFPPPRALSELAPSGKSGALWTLTVSAQDPIVISAIENSPFNHGLSGADWLASGDNFPIVFKNKDVMLFEHRGDRIFEVHYLFSVARGRAAIDQIRVGFGTMFQEYRARALFGFTPDRCRPAKIINRLVGCKSVGFVSTPFGRCEKFIISRPMWEVSKWVS